MAVGKACYARIRFYSRFKKRESLIALVSHQGAGGLHFCDRSTPLLRVHRYLGKTKKAKKPTMHDEYHRVIYMSMMSMHLPLEDLKVHSHHA